MLDTPPSHPPPADTPSPLPPGSECHLPNQRLDSTYSQLGQRVVLAAEILAGRRVGIRIEEGLPLLFFDPEIRELLPLCDQRSGVEACL